MNPHDILDFIRDRFWCIGHGLIDAEARTHAWRAIWMLLIEHRMIRVRQMLAKLIVEIAYVLTAWIRVFILQVSDGIFDGSLL